MNEIKELFESVLAKYLSVTPGTTPEELCYKSTHWGLCLCICSMGIRECLEDWAMQILHSQRVEPGTYYVTPSFYYF